MKKVLLLNSTNDILAFINERKAIRLMFKEKVEVISTWDDESFVFCGRSINFPAVIKMRYYVYRKFSKPLFSRRAILKRDQNQCQFCGVKFNDGTIDHIIPKSLGGISSFTNCVAACFPCNKKKANKLLHETNLKLLKEPLPPSGYLFYFPNCEWHKEWMQFIR